MARTRRQHYVPRFHLDTWSDRDTGLIRQYDITRSTENLVQPKNATLKKWLYELSEPRDFHGGTQAVEMWFADLEARVARVARKLMVTADQPPVDAGAGPLMLLRSEQLVLAQFMITLILRHPLEVDANAKTHEEFFLRLRYIQTPSGLFVPTSDENAANLGRDLALASLTKPLGLDHPILHWAWHLFVLPKAAPHHFITSDRPVVPIAQPDGSEMLGIQFAISPRHLLTCTIERCGELEREGFIQTYCLRACASIPEPRFVYSTPGLGPVEPTEKFSQTIKQLAAHFD